jgi:hypothetical protein
MVQFQVTDKVRLLRIEMTQGEDATPTRASCLETRVVEVVVARRVYNAFLFKIQPTIH